MAELLSADKAGTTALAVADGLFARERLGSTGLGDGVGLPHTRSDSVDEATGAFLSLSEPVDYDGAPVDLLFGLMVPVDSTEEHLQILARLAELLSQSSIRDQLRTCGDAQDVMSVLQSTSA